MKLLLENWKNFLAEEKQYQIYCDMDGVLVDFVAGVVDKIMADIDDPSIPTHKPTGGILPMGRLRQALEDQGQDTIDASYFGIEKSSDPVKKAVKNYMYKAIGDDRHFWATLPWMPEGKQIWDMIKDHDPFILTSPMGSESQLGKQDWIDANLSPIPRQVFFSHEKYEHAAPNHILIDDFLNKNITPFRAAGGVGIHHVDISETLKELANYIGDAK